MTSIESLFYIKFSLPRHYNFIQIMKLTPEQASQQAAALQEKKLYLHDQYLSGPFYTRDELLDEVIQKSIGPDTVMSNLRSLYNDPHFRNLEVSTK